ncbi:Poly(A)-specific ribonuclease [Heracleum sosnowskyi]|uniref:poly(A)-specific ribonuclease n=1 Tax=Heracleum sosnowskyi TaxID=360622 RepID=A0AAD8IXW0_9APIA|nr:Poly(A)-specific ribonuclease [Heracleum sosnowskyi]
MESSPVQKPVITVREVWEENLESELSSIQTLLKDYPYIAFDTEFPGRVYDQVNGHGKHVNRKPDKPNSDLPPEKAYSLMKANVDALKLIQLGLTLSDSDGNLPEGGCVWQFNFREFDVDKDLHNASSIKLLKRQGIDFLASKKHGVRSEEFARLFPRCFGERSLTWVTFYGAYDYGYLMKVLTQANLPGDLNKFMDLLSQYFGNLRYDVKTMMKPCRLYGGLNAIANHFKVERVAGKAHQAGSDSLLTMQVFMKMKSVHYQSENAKALNKLTCIPHGLNLKVNDEKDHRTTSSSKRVKITPSPFKKK